MWQDLFGHEKRTDAAIDVNQSLLYVLSPNQNEDSVQNPFSIAFEEVSERLDRERAEVDLKRMMRQLMIMTGGMISSPLMLSAIGLPYPISIVIWVTAVAFAEDDPNQQIEHFVQKRTRDSIKLLQSLNEYRQFLREWWQVSVARVPASGLPANLQFPVGHPLPPRLYRRHPLSSKPDCYYPVNAFYTLLYEEREQELIRLLAALGATQISIYPFTAGTSSADQSSQSPGELLSETTPRILKYAGRPISDVHFDASQYEWLTYEPGWQAVVESRVKYLCLSASLDISLDISSTIAALLDGIESLSEQLTSVQTVKLDTLRGQILKRHRVEVEFAVG